MYIVTAVKGGRCWNGAHRDAGHVHHAVFCTDPTGDVNGFWGNPALCGVTPGIRGYGWVPKAGEQVTCLKCLKKLGNNTK